MYKEYLKDEEGWTEAIKTTDWNENDKYNYHYVAFAIPGLTFAAEYFYINRSLNYKKLFYEINSANEAGTLFPLHKATYLPVNKANYYMETIKHRENTSEKDQRKYFKDVEKSNTMFGTDTIVLDLRDFDLILEKMKITKIALEELENSFLIKKIIVLS